MKLFIKDTRFYKTVAAITIPIALQSLIALGINLADNMMVGRLGETALSGVTLGNEFINFFQVCCMGMGMGASVLTARFFGAKDYNSLRKSIAIMLRFCLSIAMLFTLAVALVPDVVMGIYSSEMPVIAQGVLYFKWSAPRFILLGLTLTLTIVLRSTGQMRVPLCASILAFLMNIPLNYLLIFGKFGFPELGVEGAAIATVIARIFECSVIVIYFFHFEKMIGYRLKHLTMHCGDLIGEYFRVSIPVLISDMLLGLGNSAVAMVIGRLGESFVAANAITTMARQISAFVVQGVSQTGAIVVGQTLGTGEIEKAKAQGEAFLGLGMFLGVIAAVVILLIREPLIGIYDISEGTKAIARQLMNAISINIFFQSCNGILTKGVLRGGGDTRFLMVCDILFLWVVSIPLGIVAGFYLHLSPFLIYTCLKMDQILKCFWATGRLRSGKWIKKIKSA